MWGRFERRCARSPSSVAVGPIWFAVQTRWAPAASAVGAVLGQLGRGSADRSAQRCWSAAQRCSQRLRRDSAFSSMPCSHLWLRSSTSVCVCVCVGRLNSSDVCRRAPSFDQLRCTLAQHAWIGAKLGPLWLTRASRGRTLAKFGAMFTISAFRVVNIGRSLQAAGVVGRRDRLSAVVEETESASRCQYWVLSVCLGELLWQSSVHATDVLHAIRSDFG